MTRRITSFSRSTRSLLAARLGADLERFGTRLDATLIEAVLRGRRHSAVDLQRAVFARTRCFGELQALLLRHDVLVSPTLSAPPLPVEMELNAEVIIAGHPAGTVRGAWYPYTCPMNLTGHPALSMPCGWSAGGLPVGLQLVGRWHDDACLLRLAALLEGLLGA